MSMFDPAAFLSTLKSAVNAFQLRQVEAAIPKVPLRAEHVANCRLLLNRQALLHELPTRSVCAEIGVDQGDFTDAILRVAQPSQLHLVDTWGSRRYNETKFEQVRNRFARELQSGTVVIHRKLSLEAVSDFEDACFDWIYLDTTHAYELTAQELRAYAAKIKTGGLMCGHDYSMGNWIKAYRYGVIEAVHEFCVTDGWELVYLTLEPIECQSFSIRRIAAPVRAS
jgi:hypothetical protein